MKKYFFILLLALCLSFLVYPAAFIQPTSSLPDDNDTRLIAYIIGQVQNNLLSHKPLFFGTFFAPYPDTLTYSEPFLTSGLLTLPFRIFSTSPVAIANFAYIIGFTLTFFAGFIFFDLLFADFWTSLFTTLLFNLSGFHLTYLPHLQMYSLWSVFLSLYFFIKHQKTSKNKYLLLSFLSLTFQLTESLFGVYLIFFSILILLFFSDKPFNQKIGELKRIFVFSLPFIPIWFLFLAPYLRLPKIFPEASRSIRDAAHFSLGLEEIFTVYHALSFIIIFFLTLIITRKRSAKFSPYWVLFAFSLLLALGPVLKFMGKTVKIFQLPIPLPYTLFYYLFPGFTGLRTPSRFIILTALAAGVIVGYKLLPLFRQMKPVTKFTFLLSFTLIILLEARIPKISFPVDTRLPVVYKKVADLPASDVILELPVKLWNDDGHEVESLRSLYSLAHGHRRFGGFSGFAPNAWIGLVENLKAYGLNQTNLKSLHDLGVTYVVSDNQLTRLP